MIRTAVQLWVLIWVIAASAYLYGGWSWLSSEELKLVEGIGVSCDTDRACREGLVCAGGTDFSHLPQPSTCQLPCDHEEKDACPAGLHRVSVFDAPGSDLPSLCQVW